MSGFQIWIPREHLASIHQRYSSPNSLDVLNIKQRIEQQLNLETSESDSNLPSVSILQGENWSNSTNEVNVVHGHISDEDDLAETDIGNMDRADVLYKYILRSFRKHYCKNFNDVTEYRKRKRRVTLKLTLLTAMTEFRDKIFPGVTLPDLEIYMLSLITHRVSLKIPKRNKWSKIKDLMKTTLYQFNRKRLQTFLAHPQFAFLLLKFLETPDILSTLSDRSQLIKDEKCRRNLMKHIEILKTECISKMSQTRKDFQA